MSLRQRTRQEFYAEWAQHLRDGGIPEDQIEEAIRDSIRTAQSILDGKCPKCGQPIARYVNGQMQEGPSDMPGAWVMYRCSTAPAPGNLRGDACDFMIDLVDGSEAN